MKRIFVLLLAAVFAAPIFVYSGGVAEANASVSVAQRELKKTKDYEHSDLYARAHHIIYGDKAPLGAGGRTRIGVIINGDAGMVVEDRVKNVIYQALRKKFPRDEFAVMKATDLNTVLMQKAEDEYAARRAEERNVSQSGVSAQRPSATVGAMGGVVKNNDELDVDGMRVLNQPRGIADLTRTDYVEAGQQCGYDYVCALTLTNGDVSKKVSRFLVPFVDGTSVRSNGWLRVRFVDVASGNYLYRRDIVTMGHTHNGDINGRVYEQSVRKAITEAMNDLAISD